MYKYNGQVKSFIEEKRSLKIKHEKVCAENKIFKNKNEALVKDVNSLNVCIKTLKKEVKASRYKNEKNCEALEAKIKTLTEVKTAKNAEEKYLKRKTKKVDKKIKNTKRERSQNQF